MSKRFDGIAIAKDLGQDNGANSSVLENVKGVLYAENINSVIYYDKNLDQLNDGEAPTKKYVQPLRDTNDSIQITVSNFNNWGYTEQEFINSIEQQFGETDPDNVLTSIDSIYECFPSNSEYRIEWNGKTYYKWNCMTPYWEQGSNPFTKYFLTETCNYTELQQRTMRYAYERGLAYWDKTYKLSTISVAEFDEDNNEIDYYGDRISDAHDLRITDIKYIKNAKSTTINYDDVQGVKYVDIKIGDGKEKSTCDWITLTIGPGSATTTDKHYVCNPSDPNYIFTYNNQKYFLWKYIGTGNADESYWSNGSEQHAYFITSIADYDVLLNCVGNTLNNYLIAEFNIDKNEVRNILGSNKITSISHFPGLYFKSVGSTEIRMVHDYGSDVNNPNIEYSTNYGRTWTVWSGSTIQLSDEQIILFRGLNPDGFNNYNFDLYSNFIIGGSGTIQAYGSVMSLIDQIGELLTIPSNDNGGCFYYLFYNCSKLVKAPALPATSLANYCYSNMFRGCTVLTKAPALPATSLAGDCYSNMFQGCTALTKAPALPATSLADHCYCNMFQGCTSLAEAPALPATGLAPYCYQSMFQGCTALTNAPALPATGLAIYCYSNMFNGCTSLTEAPILPAISLNDGCYHQMFDSCASLTEAPALPATSLASWCYSYMFQGCTSLTEVPVLPATSLATQCYYSMFYGCTSLTEAPALPATSLATQCYYMMFSNCTSLTEAPALPATSLAAQCYYMMFRGCTSLTEAPALPATSLATQCYYGMFYGCTSLTEAPALPATSLATQCYSLMYRGCKNLSYINCNATTNIKTINCANWVSDVAPYGTFVKNPSATWSTGISGIPTNWVSTVSATNNQEVNFVSVHILQDPKITTPSITISFSSVSANQVLEYTKTAGGWIAANAGDSVTITGTEILYLRGTLNGNNTTKDYTNIQITSSNGSKAILSGNCNAIWNYNSPTTSLSYQYCGNKLFYGSTAITKVSKNFLPATSLAHYCYQSMFQGCTALTNAPALPATSLAKYCYYTMFRGCTSLKKAPALPATSLTLNCYYYMFKSCTSLTEAPALPATNLHMYCYSSMFESCTALTKAPILPATRMSTQCYYLMFNGCTSLIEAPALPATSLAPYCYQSMFQGCTALTNAPALPATSLAEGCYGHMFGFCASLTEAPILPATSLATRCYYYMFTNCKNLSYINCNAINNITASNCSNWVPAVASYGTFYKNSSATWSTGVSGIPSGWNSISLNNINSVDKCIEIKLDGLNDVTITFVSISTNHTLEYKDSDHNSWTTVSVGDTITLSYSSNPVVLLKGELSGANTKRDYTQITISGGNSANVKLIGNCNYLWNSDPDAALKPYCGYKLFYGSTAITKVSKDFLPTTSLADYCYSNMFQGCTSLTEAPALPATSLAARCYQGMFDTCTSLSKAPALPATSLVLQCYSSMFYGCTSLTEAPALPATSLAEGCYESMFCSCKALKKAPALPATSLVNECYIFMFDTCTSLTEAPALPATRLADYCYPYMFNGCTSLKKAPALPATSLAARCYQGMFDTCTSLSEAPALPASSLADYCYSNMFYGCTSLKNIQALPATSLAEGCYDSMFCGCTSLKKSPALPATSLVTDCYSNMFGGCTSLTEAPILPAISLNDGCYHQMFDSCASLTEAPALPATNLVTKCYNNMFRGCTSLNEVICFATTNSYSDSTTDWLASTSTSGKIYSKTSTNISVPSGWTIQTF